MVVQAIGAIASLAGKGVGGAGEVQANKARAKRKADLEATGRLVGSQLDPLKDSLLPGLAPGGMFRTALAAPGLTRAQQASMDALSKARSIGTRTSTKAQGFDALVQSVLEKAGVTSGADLAADQALAQAGLDELGFSDLFNVTSGFDRNPFAFAAGGLEGLGSTLQSFQTATAAEQEDMER